MNKSEENVKHRVVFAHELVEENGKTVRENNMEKTHKYPLGEVVEVTMGFDIGWGAAAIVDRKNREICLGVKEGTFRLYVVGHQRDCDGSLLYMLSDLRCKYPTEAKAFDMEGIKYRGFAQYFEHGIGEESLKPVGYRTELSENIYEHFGFSNEQK